MRIALFIATVLACATSTSHADPRQVCIATTVSDGTNTLAAPIIAALDGELAKVTISSGDLTLELAMTARLQSDTVALDVSYNETDHLANGASTTRSTSTRAVVKDRESLKMLLPERQVVITPTRMGAGHDRCSH